MESVPILFDGDYSQGAVGKVEMTERLAELYSSNYQYLVMNPILQGNPDGGPPTVIAFSVYVGPVEPAQEKKKRRKKKKG